MVRDGNKFTLDMTDVEAAISDWMLREHARVVTHFSASLLRRTISVETTAADATTAPLPQP